MENAQDVIVVTKELLVELVKLVQQIHILKKVQHLAILAKVQEQLLALVQAQAITDALADKNQATELALNAKQIHIQQMVILA